MSECVLKTLACQGLRVGPSKGISERAKGAEKVSCGETLVQKGVLGESAFSLPPKVFRCFKGNPLGGQRRSGLTKTPFWTTVSLHRRLLRSVGAPPVSQIGPLS